MANYGSNTAVQVDEPWSDCLGGEPTFAELKEAGKRCNDSSGSCWFQIKQNVFIQFIFTFIIKK